MGLFLEKVHQKATDHQGVVSKEAGSNQGTKGPLGTCDSPKLPIPIAIDVPVKPDCINQAGCLFCSKHHVVADEDGTRKLASCAFVIQQTMYLPGAEVHFKPSLDQIEAYLNEIKTFDGCAEMVDRVIRDVNENGNLDPYWAQKILLLDSLEIIL